MFKETMAVVGFNFKQWHKNPRIIMTFILGFVLCLLLTDKAISFAMNYGTTMQIFEAFVWTFGDANSIMVSSLLLILLFADMPFIGAVTPYYLVRTRRNIWLSGQILYVIFSCIIYMGFMLLVTVLLTAQISFPGNMWSETGATLAYSGVGVEIMLPASLKTMIMSYPYQCTGHIFLLMTMYVLFLVSFMMVINLKRGKFWGIISAFLVSVYGLLLNPQIFMSAFRLPEAVAYKANVAVGWLSPLNHATYYMHNFGYDYLPRLWMTYLIFTVLIVICFIACSRAMKKYNFMFMGTDR